MSDERVCSETGRSFANTAEARASEARFYEVQAECAAGRVPELRAGDVIYVDSELYLGHGRDDFCGGLAEVVAVSSDITRVRVEQEGPVPATAGGWWDRLKAWILQRERGRPDGTYWAMAQRRDPFVLLAGQPDARYNWRDLAAEQPQLRVRFGRGWAHPAPDYRPEFNDA